MDDVLSLAVSEIRAERSGDAPELRNSFRNEDGSEGNLYKGLTRYQHIERMGHQLTEGMLEGSVWVQDKMDGANMTITILDGELVIASRNTLKYSILQGILEPFNGAVDYVLKSRIEEFLKAHEGWILRGEWLVKHSIMYDLDFFHHFYVFDVQLPDGTYLDPLTYIPELEAYGIRYIPTLAVLQNPSMDDLIPLSQGADRWGAQSKEGIVIKNYSFRNRFGRAQFGKMVSADFKERNRLVFGASKKDDIELQFVANTCTPALVNKVIDKIGDAKGEPASVRDMQRVLHTTWYDLFHEELWDFAGKKRVKEFNLSQARRLAEKKTREIALARFNGIASASDWQPNGVEAQPAGAELGDATPSIGDGICTGVSVPSGTEVAF